MKTLLSRIQTELATLPELKYVDENWGQLDYYSPNMPVQWPCCLIDMQTAQFSNISKDFTKRPKDRQNATISIELTLANMKLSNTSFNTPQGQKNKVWEIFDWAENIHKKLHGFSPMDNAGKLIRTSFGRVQRDDGVQEYRITYAMEVFNV